MDLMEYSRKTGILKRRREAIAKRTQAVEEALTALNVEREAVNNLRLELETLERSWMPTLQEFERQHPSLKGTSDG